MNILSSRTYQNATFLPPGKLREILETCKLSKEILAKNTNYLDNVLETLDIQQHTIGVMFVISAKFTSLTVSCSARILVSFTPFTLSLTFQGSAADTESIIKHVKDFVQLSNPDQVRFAAGNCENLSSSYPPIPSLIRIPSSR